MALGTVSCVHNLHKSTIVYSSGIAGCLLQRCTLPKLWWKTSAFDFLCLTEYASCQSMLVRIPHKLSEYAGCLAEYASCLSMRVRPPPQQRRSAIHAILESWHVCSLPNRTMDFAFDPWPLIGLPPRWRSPSPPLLAAMGEPVATTSRHEPVTRNDLGPMLPKAMPRNAKRQIVAGRLGSPSPLPPPVIDIDTADEVISFFLLPMCD